jgi:hypothetical protein
LAWRKRLLGLRISGIRAAVAAVLALLLLLAVCLLLALYEAALVVQAAAEVLWLVLQAG